jgi:hypothetical protein
MSCNRFGLAGIILGLLLSPLLAYVALFYLPCAGVAFFIFYLYLFGG